ncbi:MAG: DUF362 domain-containing protein [Anaerolineae bacterium]|jgi:uncharacterized protein (DUF362 family)
MTQVALVRTEDRASGVERALDLLDVGPLQGQTVFLKPNFNSADLFPGSTHNDTLSALVRELQARGAGLITVGDRSGMGDTRRVMKRKGILRLAEELGFEALVLDEMDAAGWERMQPPGSHWRWGFAIARPVLNADVVVQTCCLKTHRFGGHFTLSLKNSVGLVAKQIPGERHNYMRELHSSPHQRLMIAEVNLAYRLDLILMDGLEAFVEGGPARGKRVAPGVILAGTDRVAIDAVGVAILRTFGTTPTVSRGPIFKQEQIARAVELGLGVTDPDEIALVTADRQSGLFAALVLDTLLGG